MKTKLLKISMMLVALIFVFTGTSLADSGKNRHRNYTPEKRIQAKHHGGSSYGQPVRYKHKVNRHHKRLYKKHHYRHRPAHRYRQPRFNHRHKWINKYRHHYRHQRYTSENSYDDDPSYNEFSIAATFSEPGVEFSIGTKRRW
jgi:hypothetical protein